MQTNFDIILVGAGCASMQLLHRLVNHPAYANQSILLLDAQPIGAVPKSWCYWTTSTQNPYPDLVEKQWEKLDIGTQSGTLIRTLGDFEYVYLPSHSFFSFHQNYIETLPHVHFLQEKVMQVTQNKVHTPSHTYTAKFVCSSLWEPRKRAQDIVLNQHFRGFFIRSKSACFDENVPTLMDFRVPQPAGLNFMYVLPFSPQTALVEFTSFSASTYETHVYETAIRTYLAERGITDFTVEQTEEGCIPMTTQLFSRYSSNGAIQIGTAAGSVKPATGYAFMRIQADVQLVADAILLNKPLPEIQRTRFDWYDSLLLHIIQHRQEKAVLVFEQLFKRVKMPLILQFLDQKTTIWQEIRLFSKLPILLFLRTALARL
ncbi:MAG: lycopene cyclase family protein [Spirosomataceae bacterium]